MKNPLRSLVVIFDIGHEVPAWLVKWVKPLNRADFNAKTRRGSRRRAEAALWRAAKVGGAGVE